MGTRSPSGLQGWYDQRIRQRAIVIAQSDRQVMLLLIALLMAIGGQIEISNGRYWTGLTSFAVAFGSTLLGVSALKSHSIVEQPVQSLWSHRRIWLLIPALGASMLAFLASDGNRYRPENVIPWLASIALWVIACAELKPGWWGINLASRVRAIDLGRVAALAILLAILSLGAAFRFVSLQEIPRDMIMDHAEKLLDVHDVLTGQPSIFFERNTGREPWQFYWTVGLIKLFDMPVNYLTLKTGTALIGWLMLPAVFLLARELFGTRTALLATLFAAVASWGVLGARYGLRYPLAPCATAWTLYFLVRGLRHDRRNAMIAAGICLGIGLQGYSAYRFMLPVFAFVALCALIWRYRRHERAAAWRVVVNSGLALILALLVMMPLVRYGLDHPDKLLYRANTRLTSLERQIPGSAPEIFFNNVGNVLLMFNYTTDNTWAVNLRFQPAVDPLLAGLIVIGAIACVAISVRQRDPWPLLLLGSGVLMLIPSALSIAFPRENPSLVRTGGAIPMAMIICAIIPGILLERVRHSPIWLRAVTIMCVTMVSVAVVAINRERVFVDYPVSYCENVYHTADVTNDMRAFIQAGNPRENTWFVAKNGWVDYRAVGIELGEFPYKHVAVGPQSATDVDLRGQPGLFAMHPSDTATLYALMQKYPQSSLQIKKVSDCADYYLLLTVPAGANEPSARAAP